MGFFQPDIPTEELEFRMRQGSYVHLFSISNAVFRFWEANDAKGFRDFYDIFEQYQIRQHAGDVNINAARLALANVCTSAMLADRLADGTVIDGREGLVDMIAETSRMETGPIFEFFCRSIGYNLGDNEPYFIW
jgi:hypothetical protein